MPAAVVAPEQARSPARPARRIGRFFDESSPHVRPRLVAVCIVLGVLQTVAWGWALVAFHARPALLDIALVTYGLGLRHALDADHIAAIDNVTRKLLQAGQRPVLVGFWFAIGHSAVVAIVGALIVHAAVLSGALDRWRSVGGLVSTGISAPFLIAVGLMNGLVLVSLVNSYRRHRARPGGDPNVERTTPPTGPLARVLRRLLRFVTRSWHMLPLGFVFGLGFDTVSEVTLFGVTAAQAANGMSLTLVLVFPLLFAAGMSLFDTADGVMMLGAYEQSFTNPLRRFRYDITMTLVSATLALVIGGTELLALVAERWQLHGAFWQQVRSLEDHFSYLGFVIVGLFVVAWASSAAIDRVRRRSLPHPVAVLDRVQDRSRFRPAS